MTASGPRHDILAKLVAQGFDPSDGEIGRAADRIIEEYGGWEAYQEALEREANAKLSATGRYVRKKTPEEKAQASLDSRVRHHLSLDPPVNGKLILEVLRRSWATLDRDSRRNIEAAVRKMAGELTNDDGNE